jgi:hypothetical protein
MEYTYLLEVIMYLNSRLCDMFFAREEMVRAPH